MEKIIINMIYSAFNKLMYQYSFSQQTDVDLECVEYSSDCFVVRIQKYKLEFYLTLYSKENNDFEINLFNLLEFLNKDTLNAVKSQYYHEEKDVRKRLQKQLIHLSNQLYSNYTLIYDFFCSGNLKNNVFEFENYWKAKYPELYKTIRLK